MFVSIVTRSPFILADYSQLHLTGGARLQRRIEVLRIPVDTSFGNDSRAPIPVALAQGLGGDGLASRTTAKEGSAAGLDKRFMSVQRKLL